MESVLKFWRKAVRPALRKFKNSWLLPMPVELNFPYTLEAFSLRGRVSLAQKDEQNYVVQVQDPLDSNIVHVHHFGNRYGWHVRDALFNAKTANVLLNGHPIQEAVGVTALSKTLLVTRDTLKRGLDQRPYVALGVGSKNYYHWLLEDFPVALRAREINRDVEALIPKNVPSFVLATLDQASMPFSQKRGMVRVPNLIVPTRSEDSGWHRRSDLDLIRNSVGVASPSRTNQKKLYISRRFSNRAFENEKQIEDFLLRRGFDVLYLERLSFSAQTELFSSAEIVVGTHGAGLSNIVFANQQARVIEIATMTYSNYCFETLAHALELDYSRVLAPPGKAFGSGLMTEKEFLRLESLIG